jgi:predicted CopG family antitoxin
MEGNYRTTVEVSSAVRDRLRAEKTGSETYDDVIKRLLEDE